MIRLIKKHIVRHWQLYVLAAVALGLFLIPNLLWGGLYMVGGDDARLYYIFPLEYLKNALFNVISHNTFGGNMGYWPISYPAPTIAFLWLIKTVLPMFNTQMIAYGLIFSLGFVFFYLFLQEWVIKKTAYSFWSGIAASLAFIFSPYIVRTFFQHQLISIFALMVVPGVMYFFLAGIRRKNMKFIVAGALFYSIFSSTLYSIPWVLPVFFTLIPLFIYFRHEYGVFVWKALGVFVGVTVALNLYWIVHFIIPVLFHSVGVGVIHTLLSKDFLKQNDDLIAALTRLNSPVNQIINHLRTSWSEETGASVRSAIGVVYFLIILFAGAVSRGAAKAVRTRYIFALTGLLFAMFFVTPNFGELNLKLFQLFSNYVPFFTTFRNMYDKFALAMAFSYALALFSGLVALEYVPKIRMYKYLIIILLIGITLGMRWPYTRPGRSDAAYSLRISGKLNTDFFDLIAYLKQTPTTSRYVWLPMTYPGYTFISDSVGPNHFYSGISPLQVLAHTSDIDGFYGIQTPADSDLNSKFMNLLIQKNYDALGNIFKEQNIGFVIENHERLPQQALTFLDAYGFMASQSAEYKTALVGEKIRDFGARYTLYRINTQYAAPTVFLTDTLGNHITDIRQVMFFQQNDTAYEIDLMDMQAPADIVLLEPFSSFWRISLIDGNRKALLSEKPTLAYGYGNAWHIDPSRLQAQYPEYVRKSDAGLYKMKLLIEFWPKTFTVPALVISIISAIVALFYLCIRI